MQYVALPLGPLAHVGAGEGRLVGGGLPYLTEVWRGGAWTLYEVAGSPSLADGAQVLAGTPTTLRLRVGAPGDVLVRVADTRFLTLSGPGCLAPQGRWLRLHARAAGDFVLGSRLTAGGAARC